MDIKEIKNPKFLKDLTYDQCDELCQDIRNEILRVTKINGGHLSSNLGAVELTVALHKSFDFSKDKIFFDVGHQCYAHKILTGRSLDNLRKKDGISGFPKVSESIYDHFEGGHSSNSLSNALGYAVARDKKGENYDIVCVIGDASIVNGLAFEALNDSSIQNHKMIIVLNDNGMSISKGVGNVNKIFSNISTSGLYNKSKLAYRRCASKTKSGRKFYEFLYNFKNSIKRMFFRGNFFVDLGFNYIGVVDGHNIKELEKAIKKAKNSTKTTIIHVKTIKGLGLKEAENDKLGVYHAVLGPNDNPNKYKTWSQVYSSLYEKVIIPEDDALLLCPATLVGSSFFNLHELYPSKIIDVGIAEEHALSCTAGLSMNGLKPYVSIYSTFLQRAFDELSHDIARMKLNCTLLIDRCGLAGGDGDTHQGIFEEAFLINTPNTVLCMASTWDEAERLLTLSKQEQHGIMCIRYPKDYAIVEKGDPNFNTFDWKKPIANNNKKVIVSFGPVINDLKEIITKKLLKIDLINAIYQKPLNNEYIDDIVNNYDEVILFDQYATEAGFNNSVISELIKRNYKGKIISKALKLDFGKGETLKEGLKEQRMDPESFIEDILNE